jgi:LPS-assembly protein
MDESGSVRGQKGPRVVKAGRLAAMSLKSGLLAGAAALALFGGSAHAQITLPTPQPLHPAPPAPPPPVVEDDGLGGGGFYLEADRLFRDDIHHTTRAEGAVEARYEGKVLHAEEVDYDSDTGVVTARGHVQVIEPDGRVQFADAITLDKDLSAGVALGFSSRMEGNVKIAAARARRQSADVTELDDVIYTPCATCAENGSKTPTWSIKASKVVEDRKHETISFQHAVIQVKGVGVFYLPRLWMADPSAAHKQGFLLPTVTFSGERGFSYQQPYYIPITNHQDIIISPQINSKVNPFLNIDYRERFYSGWIDVRAGYTYDRDFTSGGTKFGPDTSRSYILGSGVFNLSPTWQWGFTAEQTSDKLLFQKYSVPDVFANENLSDRGLYAADDLRLISQLYAVHQNDTSYLSVAAISVQGLRATDDQSTFPTIAPLIEAHWEPDMEILGGRLRLDGSAVALTRSQAPDTLAPSGSPPIAGLDSRRATASLDWQSTFTLSNGLRIQPFVDGRFDLYNTAGLPGSPSGGTVAREIGWVGANFSYPLFKQVNDVTYVLEPLAQVEVAPNTQLNPLIPNEDSEVWEFDDTNLFSVNRSPGYDLYEGGQSVTLAGRATAMLGDGRSASLLFGRRLGFESDPAVPSRTGLATALSDYIIAFEATPVQGITVFTKMRMNSASFGIDRLETGVNFSTDRASGYISYLDEANSPLGGPVRSIDVHGEVYPFKHWGVTTYGIVDSGTWRREEIGLIYRDDCVRVEVLYRHDDTFNGTLGPSTSVVLRLKLATLGNSS